MDLYSVVKERGRAKLALLFCLIETNFLKNFHSPNFEKGVLQLEIIDDYIREIEGLF